MTKYLLDLYNEIKHGDEEHQKWLFDKMEEYSKRDEELYEFKGHTYRVVNDGKMKIEGVWIPCIIYERLSDPLKYWVRSEEAFFERFKPKDGEANN